MARAFRSSRFRGGDGVGEDVSPSAYIVNLADCMLVLACGFLVALVSFYNIDIVTAEELEDDQLEQVEPENLPEDLLSGGGSYYVEAGKVYRDPNTGVLYMVEAVESEGGQDGSSAASGASVEASTGTAGSASAPAGSANAGATGTTASGSSGSGSQAGSAASNGDAARNARANGAD